MIIKNKEYRDLLKMLNEYTTNSLHAALGFCQSRAHGELSIEHLLLKLIEDGRGDVPLILSHFDIEQGAVSKAINRTLEGFRTGSADRNPALSPILMQIIESA